MDQREARQAHNELFFRSVNESIEDIGDDVFDSPEERGRRPYEFLCECHRTDCTERIPLTIPEYENVRSDSRQFLVAPAAEHVNESVEEIVDRSSRYWVVRKVGEAGRLADADAGAREADEPDISR